jgi:hypothetical protein
MEFKLQSRGRHADGMTADNGLIDGFWRSNSNVVLPE